MESSNCTDESMRCVGSGRSTIVDPDASEFESRKLPSSKFKGVVPQPNGRWGAQIYEKHQRVWLGTFNEEQEAARAYDVAASRFRGREGVTNFRRECLEEGCESEMCFLRCHSKAEVVDMLRKHTYDEELEQSRRLKGCSVMEKACLGSGFVRESLFEKAVTPSDVGKLNRLVIPKQHAERHFPLSGGGPGAFKGVLLNFEDVNRKVWRFRYSYWNSSQSYVLTKGWSRFVKEKGLRAGDTVGFYRSPSPHSQLYIDWKVRMPPPPVRMVRLFGVDIFNIPISIPALEDHYVNVNVNGKIVRQTQVDVLSNKKPRAIPVNVYS